MLHYQEWGAGDPLIEGMRALHEELFTAIR